MPAKKSPQRAARKPSAPPSPSEFASGLFVGGWKEARAFSGTRFCVLDEAPDDMPSATHITIYDGATDRPIVANLDRLARAMRAARARKEPVIVFCGHGVRRSPLAAAWYLHRAEKIPLDKAFARVRAARPGIEDATEWIGHPEGLG